MNTRLVFDIGSYKLLNLKKVFGYFLYYCRFFPQVSEKIQIILFSAHDTYLNISLYTLSFL